MQGVQKAWGKTSLGAVLVIALTAILIGWHHHALIGSLNSSYLGASEDGLKNYYTLLYHLRHDDSFSRFEGMNYPFGEQVVFTDNQPVLANTLKALKPVVDLSPYGVGIMNGAILFSLLLCGFFLYRLLRDLELPVWAAVLAASGLAMLSPQMLRMSEHYALAYTWVIPGYLWLMLRYLREPTLKKALVMGLFTAFVSGLHLYYLAILLFFTGFGFAVSLLSKEGRSELPTKVLHLLVQVVIPFVVFKAWMWLTDPVSDRPDTPYGFLLYIASPASVFLPMSQPYINWFEGWYNPELVNWEGLAYVGAFGVIGLLLAIPRTIYRAIRERWQRLFAPADEAAINRIWWASVFMLLLSFGLPFAIDIKLGGSLFPLSNLLEYLGPMKQFRSLGRLSWVFFYVLNIALFFGWYRILHKQAWPPWLKHALLLVPVLLIHWEAYRYQEPRLKNQFRIAEWEVLTAELPADHWTKHIDASDYQAIFPLPYFHVGSENFRSPGSGDAVKSTFVASLISGLPTTAVQMSRTSFAQSVNNLQLAWEPLRDLAYLEQLPSEKPFLLLVNEQAEIPAEQQKLLSYARFLYRQGQQAFYALPTQAFQQRIADRKQQVADFIDSTNWHAKPPFQCSDSLATIQYFDFEEVESSRAYRGKGALTGNIRQYQTAFDGRIPEGDHLLSAWIYMGEDGLPGISLVVEQLDQDRNVIGYDARTVAWTLTAWDNGWGLIEYALHSPEGGSLWKISLYQAGFREREFFLDELLIRPVETKVYRPDTPNGIWYNNRLYQ